MGLVLLLSSGCSPYFNQNLSTKRAFISPETPVGKELRFLPEPKQKQVVAVYKFRDQTGQYKPSESGASWSNAVSQGGTSILLRALENSGWFRSIERENLGNLLNERKIINSSRLMYGTGDKNAKSTGPLQPALLYAGVILEGGVIAYESNVMTGGVGVRYFGVGGSANYREDRITVYLRAVSTKNGEILKTVRATKTILSQKLDGGIFQFVAYKRLLEAETGFTYNEPSETALTEAIEKAVQSMIIEGVFDGLWDLKNAEDIKSQAFQDYIYEKEMMANQDFLGRPLFTPPIPRYRFGVKAGLNQYQGDLFQPALSPSIEFVAGTRFYDYLELNGGFGYNQYKTENGFDASYLDTKAGLRLYFLPKEMFTPFIGADVSLMLKLKHTAQYNASDLVMSAGAHFGGELLLNKSWGIEMSFGYYYFNKDDIDGRVYGRYMDSNFKGQIGLNYHFGR